MTMYVTKIQHDHALRLAIHFCHWWSTVVKVIGKEPGEIHPGALEVALRFQAEREADRISVDTVNDLAALYNLAEGRSDAGVHLRVEGENIVHVTSTKRSSWTVNPAGDVRIVVHRPTHADDDVSRVEWRQSRARLGMLTQHMALLDAELLAHEEDGGAAAVGEGEEVGPRRSTRCWELCTWIQTVANAFDHEQLKAMVQVVHTTFELEAQRTARMDLFRAYRGFLPGLLDRARRDVSSHTIESKDVLVATIVDGVVTISRVDDEPISVRHVLALEAALVGAMGDERYFRHPDVIPLWAAVEDIDEVGRSFTQTAQQIMGDVFRRRSGRGFPLMTIMSPRVGTMKVAKLWERLAWIHACYDGIAVPVPIAPLSPSDPPASSARPVAA